MTTKERGRPRLLSKEALETKVKPDITQKTLQTVTPLKNDDIKQILASAILSL